LIDVVVQLVQAVDLEERLRKSCSRIGDALYLELELLSLVCPFLTKDRSGAQDVDVLSAFIDGSLANYTHRALQGCIRSVFLDQEAIVLDDVLMANSGAVGKILGHHDPEEAVNRHGVRQLEVENVCLINEPCDV
jgi:hypothetical protein